MDIPVTMAMRLTGADTDNYGLTKPAGLKARIFPPPRTVIDPG